MKIKTNKDLIIDGKNIPRNSVGNVRGISRTDDLEFYNVMFAFGEYLVNFKDAERTRD